jgi:hypothetical protein
LVHNPAKLIHPPVRVLPDEQTRELAEWVQRRHQLVEMLTAERNRLRAMSGSARADIETHIDWLEKRRLPQVQFHFIPTHSCWLNQVECWFSILSRGALQGASFTSVM